MSLANSTALSGQGHSFPDVHYVLAGRGDDLGRVEELAVSLGVRESVTFAGYVAENELCAHYNLCDVFAMPSKGEGFGIVFLEAMGRGKPVLAGNKDGSVDPLLNGELGALADPDDVQEIANALIAILERKLEGRNLKVERGAERETGDLGRCLPSPIPNLQFLLPTSHFRLQIFPSRTSCSIRKRCGHE